jgi:nitrite reductase (NAD(P)H)
VTIINRQAHPLSRQLDADAGEMVRKKIEAMGVRFLGQCQVKDILTRPDDEGTGEVFTGFEFTDGEQLECDLVRGSYVVRTRDIHDQSRLFSPSA